MHHYRVSTLLDVPDAQGAVVPTYREEQVPDAKQLSNGRSMPCEDRGLSNSHKYMNVTPNSAEGQMIFRRRFDGTDLLGKKRRYRHRCQFFRVVDLKTLTNGHRDKTCARQDDRYIRCNNS